MTDKFDCYTYSQENIGTPVRVYVATSAADAIAFVRRVKEGDWIEYAGVKFARPAFGEDLPIVWAEMTHTIKLT